MHRTYCPSVLLRVLAAAASIYSYITPATAQVYEKLYDFREALAEDARNKGSDPSAALVQSRDGNFYGTTGSGGAGGAGTVFRMTPAGAITTLVEFTGNGPSNKGSFPYAALVQDGEGNFYGTTAGGGSGNDGFGFGTVFRMTPGGVLTTLVEFTGNGASNKGSFPGGLVRSSDGNFYGTTREGGASDEGTVFRMTPVGVLTTLVEFTGNGASNKGRSPSAALVQGSDGSFYGTTTGITRFGESINHGTVFRVTPAGALTTLLQFTGNGDSNKGRQPEAALVQGSDGNFYGTTSGGGVSNRGTVFRMTPAGVLTTLVEFTGNGASNKGSFPQGALVQGGDGSFYGTTNQGGAFADDSDDFTAGTVFRIAPAGVLTTLVEFTYNGASNKGSYPRGALVQGSDGTLYGTTVGGGASGVGTVFRMTPAGVLTTLVEFTGNGTSDKGRSPAAALAQGSDGNFYGTTLFGGVNHCGTVFRITPAGVLTTLVEFTGNGASNKGSLPEAPLVQGNDGNLYGTTVRGGASDLGTVFRMTPAGALTTLVEFTGDGASDKGSYPFAALVQSIDGHFYGTTGGGGASANGTVFRMTSAGVLTTLVEFTGNGASNKGSGANGLVRGADGNFYGTTAGGGASGDGTVFRMTPAGALTTLVEFTGNGVANKGRFPYAALAQGADGNFYGTTSEGGASFVGTIFRMTPAGVLTSLVEFTGNGASNKGIYPEAALVQGRDGNFYGTTAGQRFGSTPGTVFRMTPAGVLTTLREFSEGTPQTADGLQVAADGDIYGVNTFPEGSIYRLVFPGAPTVGVRNVAPTGSGPVLIEALANARGATATVTLEYGTDGISFPQSVPVASGLTGFQSRLVGATLSGLVPGTTYSFRMRGVNSSGTTLTPVQSFSTLAEPVVTISPATDVAPTSGRFNGRVNARNFDTTAVFEWGTDGNSFPNTVSATPGTITGNSPVAVSAPVAGLPEGAVVFYRLRATNAAGTVVSGVSSFSLITVTTNAATDVRVSGATMNGLANTGGKAASVFFEYGTDGATFPFLTQATPPIVDAAGGVAVSARIEGLASVSTHVYRVKVVLNGVETLGLPVSFTTTANNAPSAVDDVIFHTGQAEFEPLLNDEDGDFGETNLLKIERPLVRQPARGQTVISEDQKRITFTVLGNSARDSLEYRNVDPHGKLSDPATVHLIYTGPYAGRHQQIKPSGSGLANRVSISIDVTPSGTFTGFFTLTDVNGANESRQNIVGDFRPYGVVERTFAYPRAPFTTTLILRLDANQSKVTGELIVRSAPTMIDFSTSLALLRAVGGTAAPGRRTAHIDPPNASTSNASESNSADRGTAGPRFGDGFLLMTIEKNKRRHARFVGRLPDTELFSTNSAPAATAYEVNAPLYSRGRGGELRGMVEVNAADAASGETGSADLLAQLSWEKNADSTASHYPAGINEELYVEGLSYPKTKKKQLVPIGLSSSVENATLRLSGGNLPITMPDVLLSILPTRVLVVGTNPHQVKLKIKSPDGTFSGSFVHPMLQQSVTFQGAFQAAFGDVPGEGRGNFLGQDPTGTSANETGSVRVLVNDR